MALSGFSPWAAFLLFAQAGMLWAQETARDSGLATGTLGSPGSPPNPAGTGASLDWLGVGGAFRGLEYAVAFLLVLAAAAILFYRGNGLVGGGRGLRKLNVEETRSLGQRQFLAVVEYEGRKMLLGVCPGRIDYLCPLEERGSVSEDFQSLVSEVSPALESKQSTGVSVLKTEQPAEKGAVS